LAWREDQRTKRADEAEAGAIAKPALARRLIAIDSISRTQRLAGTSVSSLMSQSNQSGLQSD
jgi:hypothetical protein